MGILDLFKKKNKKETIIDSMDDQELRDKIQRQSIELIKNEIGEIDHNSSIDIQYKYLERVENKGLQSLYIVKVDSRPFYFCIQNGDIQLLSDEAKDFFDFDEEDSY